MAENPLLLFYKGAVVPVKTVIRVSGGLDILISKSSSTQL
jgi:hypothetical protein